jgi:hypothetical protein
MKIVSSIFILLLLAPSAYAEYCATGKFVATECSGLIMKSCEKIQIDAVKSFGEMRFLPKCYPSVTSYNKKKSICSRDVGSRNSNLLSKAIDVATLPTFLHKNHDGSFTSVSPDRIDFKCITR